MLLTGPTTGLRMVHGRPVSPGSEVTLDILVTKMEDFTQQQYPLLRDIVSLIVQFSFVGVEYAIKS